MSKEPSETKQETVGAGKEAPGLGELLRHLTELVDGGAAAVYLADGVEYRPRYTPVMRLLARGEMRVTELTARLRVTQGAVSQTMKLMEADGLIQRRPDSDARSRAVSLTGQGRALLARLQGHWGRTFQVIAELEEEIGHPLREILGQAVSALERRGFDQRLRGTPASPMEKEK